MVMHKAWCERMSCRLFTMLVLAGQVTGCVTLGDQHLDLHPAKGAEPQDWMYYADPYSPYAKFVERPPTVAPVVIGNGRRIAVTVRDQLADRKIGDRAMGPSDLDKQGKYFRPGRPPEHWVILDAGAASGFRQALANALDVRGFGPITEDADEPLRLMIDLQNVHYRKWPGMTSAIMRIDMDATVTTSNGAQTLRREFSATGFGDLGYWNIFGGTHTEDRVQYAMNAVAWDLIQKILDDPAVVGTLE